MKNELEEAWNFLEANGYKPYYLAVYGSQNYNLDIYTDEYKSDVDFKCIIIPTIDELVRNSKPLSKVIDIGRGQIDIKDIRAYTESVVKCNVNFLEILNTEHYIGPEFFRGELKSLMSEMGAFYLKACYGMMLEKQVALRHPYPSTKDKIDKFGYDPKQLHHIVRLSKLMQRYIEGTYPYFQHSGIEQDTLKRIKMGYVNDSSVDLMVEDYINNARNIRDEYKVDPIFDTKNRIIEMSYSIIKEQLGQQI